jgi:AraC family transcriptional regulator
MKTLTRESYGKRIERVLDYISAHLDEDLDLHRLAQEAFLSPYHFHRVYVAMMGESLADTIRRRRLYAAAVKLLSSARAIGAIARESGYASTQAFSRAFRETYGVTPAQYRLHGELSHAMQQRVRPHPKEVSMFKLEDVSVQQQPTVHALALKHAGDYQLIGQAFERLMAWAAGKGLLEKPMRLYALYYDDPRSKPKEQLLSDACLAPSETAGLDAVAQGGVRALTIPAGRCATYLFKGPYSELDKPYRWLYDTWLAQSGEELALTPPYEEYLNDARMTPPAELLTRICLPLRD